MPRPLIRGMLGDSTIILSKDVDKYAFMCGSNFYESDVRYYFKGLMSNVHTPLLTYDVIISIGYNTNSFLSFAL